MKALFLIVGALASAFARAQAPSCTAPIKETHVAVPGHPFATVATADGCWLFVSIVADGNRGSVAVLRNHGGAFALDHVLALKGRGHGESLTIDGRVLLVAADDDTAVLDVAGLEHGDANPLLGMLHDGPNSGAIYTAVTPDDRLLFVSDENARRISVFDLARARSDGFRGEAPIGRIPTATAPVGLALSPDGRWLYSTNEVGPVNANLPVTCKPEKGSERMHQSGVLLRIDVDKIRADPGHAVVAALPAGCNPVRVAVSPSGKQLWVTARGDHTLLRFAADEWLAGSGKASDGSFPIGTSPVGVAVRPDGKQVWVALSNRFNSDRAGRLAGLAADVASGSSIELMSARAAGFPREVIFLPDGRTLVATLFDARQVEFLRTPD